MINSTKHKKNTNEDPKTSVVFENLMLLPDHVFWSILKKAAANQGILPNNAGLLFDNYEFWPKWDANSTHNTGNCNFVEPDIFFRFENIDVIVEAKYTDSIGQNHEEWEREFKAYLNEYEDENKDVVLLAVGGNPKFTREPALEVGNKKCPIVKFSWVDILRTVLDFEEKELNGIDIDDLSLIKRIIRNIEMAFDIIGVHKYNKKVELNGLRNLFTLGKVFQEAITRETDLYTLSYGKENVNSSHYGYLFELIPNDKRRKPMWLSIALWINNQEVITIEARPENKWADKICKLIDEGKRFTGKYADKPYFDEDYRRYYFEATKLFYKDFNEAETFDAQVDLVSKYIDEVCLFYIR